MSLIQTISSTLKTWVFKNKVLKFSKRFARDPQACFYCPEMCRFSCPVAENLKTDAVTPRGKMTLLHLAERGFGPEKVSGDLDQQLWFLEQCTGCGRCTEYCLYEVDVATNLRRERRKYYAHQEQKLSEKESALFPRLQGKILLCDVGRKQWWEDRPSLLTELDVEQVVDIELPHLEWERGTLDESVVSSIGSMLKDCDVIIVESPAVGWFLAKHILDTHQIKIKGSIRLVWQKLYHRVAEINFPETTSLHESYHLSRLLPRLGYSIPMYEKGSMPFHSGWNSWDCGGEGFYQHVHAEEAKKMGQRFLKDLSKDGRDVSKIVCQNLSCVQHIQAITEVEVKYWLDELRLK